MKYNRDKFLRKNDTDFYKITTDRINFSVLLYLELIVKD